MASAIDPTKPADGVPSVKLNLRANLQAAKSEIEALQVGKADLGHQHLLGDLTDAGALAAKDLVESADVASGAIGTAALADDAVGEDKLAAAVVTTAKLADLAVTTPKLADGAVTGAKLAPDAVGADQLQDGIAIDMQDQLLTRPQLKDFSETSTTPAIAAGVLTLDLETGNVFEVALTGNVTSLTFANPPASGRAGSATLILKQDATGGRTVAWPASVRWAGGLAPAISSLANAVDILTFVTRDGGAAWYGFLGGRAFG